MALSASPLPNRVVIERCRHVADLGHSLLYVRAFGHAGRQQSEAGRHLVIVNRAVSPSGTEAASSVTLVTSRAILGRDIRWRDRAVVEAMLQWVPVQVSCPADVWLLEQD